jgi:mRNA-degrading endonuclease RelE of RelBE toxin-antitoxin system
MARYTSVPTPGFATDIKRLRKKFRRIDKDLGRFLEELSERPWEVGDQCPGIHPPLSKARMAVPSAGLSKRDGCRVIYRINDLRHVVFLARVYHKGEKEDVTRSELQRANREISSLEEQEAFRGKLKGGW